MTALNLGVIGNFELGANEADSGGAPLGAQRGALIVDCYKVRSCACRRRVLRQR